jgi:drug/metabolite transporter (DMT)-like permease
MTEAVKPNLHRVLSLFVAFLGSVVTVVPSVYSLQSPAPFILVGAGVTVVALGAFLFASA